MKSTIIGTLLCILVIGATFWLIQKAPIEPTKVPVKQEQETYVPPEQDLITDNAQVSRAYVIKTAHDAEDLITELAYGSNPEYKKSIQDISTRLSKSAEYLKDELKEYDAASYFSMLSDKFQGLVDDPFDSGEDFSQKAKTFLTEIENTYSAAIKTSPDENDPENPMYYPKFDTEVNGKTTLALLAIYRMQYQESNGCILLTFGGNMVPGDTLLETDSKDSFKSNSESSERPYPLYPLSSILSTDTSSFANLAVPLTDSIGNAVSAGSLKGSPSYAKLLKDGGIDVVSIANSNVLSFGKTGKEDTINALKAANLPYSDEGTIHFQDTKLGKVAYISYDIVEEMQVKGKAFEDAPKQDIETAKKAGATFVIVHFNWITTDNTSWEPSQSQAKTTRAAIDNGANLVFGSHPSVIESIEKYKGVSVVYCAGDLFRRNGGEGSSFIFQQAFSLDNDKKVVPGEILLIPIVGAGNEKGLPSLAFDKDTTDTFSKQIKNISKGMRYGVDRDDNPGFTLKHLNIITIEK
ncbi:MAG: CapA family protein [Ruminococcaceae bacterium]|nr:CapA family protein [Oscillospiraceae bacterium]